MILGLTGFSGCGKTTVSEVFAQNGFYIIDCDKIVHTEVYRKPKVLDAIAKAFGSDCIREGALDRAVLRSKTMGNKAETLRLNQTVLPLIVEHIKKIIEKNRHQNLLLDAPTLFESGLQEHCDKILCVVASPQKALERIMARDNLSREEAEKRLSSQHPATYYTQRCDFTIFNDSTLENLQAQAKKILEIIYRSAR